VYDVLAGDVAVEELEKGLVIRSDGVEDAVDSNVSDGPFVTCRHEQRPAREADGTSAGETLAGLEDRRLFAVEPINRSRDFKPPRQKS
jgi:hypothetical protein